MENSTVKTVVRDIHLKFSTLKIKLFVFSSISFHAFMQWQSNNINICDKSPFSVQIGKFAKYLIKFSDFRWIFDSTRKLSLNNKKKYWCFWQYLIFSKCRVWYVQWLISILLWIKDALSAQCYHFNSILYPVVPIHIKLFVRTINMTICTCYDLIMGDYWNSR